MNTHKVLVQYIDLRSKDSKGFILDLPVMQGINRDNVTFQSEQLPDELRFLKDSNLMFPIHKVDNYVLKKADNIIKYCESEFEKYMKENGILDIIPELKNYFKEGVDSKFNPLLERVIEENTEKLKTLQDIIGFKHGLELAIKLEYDKNETGNIHVNDICFLDSVSLSKININTLSQIITLFSKDTANNCHYHPGGFSEALNAALFSSVDTISSLLRGGENALLSYDHDTLKLWFYYTILEKGRILSVAPEMNIITDGEEKTANDIISYPEMHFLNRENEGVLAISNFNNKRH